MRTRDQTRVAERRPGAGLGRRGGSFRSIGGGGSRPPYLLNLSAAAFLRGSEASYRTGGLPLFVGSNVLRSESGLYLIEKQSSNGVTDPRDMSNASWSAGVGSPVPTYNLLDGPDGTPLVADAWVVPAASTSKFKIGLSPGAFCAGQLYRRRRPGAGSGLHNILLGNTGALYTDSSTATEAWERRIIVNLGTPATHSFIPVEGRNVTATVGPNLVQNAEDIVLDLIMTESGVRYATSVIRLFGTRQADVLSWISSEVPLAQRAARSLWPFRPVYTSAQLAAGDVRVIGSWGGPNELLRIRHTGGGGILIEAVTGGAVVAASPAITFTSADQTMTALVDPVAATITIAGATTGNGAGAAGTPWSWAGGVGFRLGGEFGGANELDGCLGIPEAA